MEDAPETYGSPLSSDRWRIAAVVVPVAAFALLNLGTQQFYVDRSRAVRSQGAATFVEIPNASASHLLDEFATLVPLAHRPGTIFVSDTDNVVFAKIQTFFTKPSAIIDLSDNFLRGIFIVPPNPALQRLLMPSLVAKAIEISSMRARHFRKPDFRFVDEYGRVDFDGFFADTEFPRLLHNPQGVLLLADTAAQSVVNRWYNANYADNFEVLPLSGVRNRLTFTAAQYGLAYYSHSKNSSLFQLETDLFYPARTMAGLGRRLLFEIINPSKKVRLEINYTATLKDDGEARLYNPSVTGTSLAKQWASVSGRGSARVFMPAITPRTLLGQPYVLLDMEVPGTLFPWQRIGLMSLYGTRIPLDGRRLVGFVRDISAISEKQYEELRPPSFLSDLHNDLLNRNLEYSGAYEDGWISEASQYVLSHPRGADAVVVRGLVPLIGDPEFHTMMTVYVAGREIGKAGVGVGTFSLQFPIRGVGPRVPVKVKFARFQRLPNGDGRPVAAKLYGLGFKTPAEAAQAARSSTLTSAQRSTWFTSMSAARVDFGSGWYPLETFGGQTFRWANNDARITVRARNSKQNKLAVDVEPGPGEAGHAAVLHLQDDAGHDLGSVTLTKRQQATFSVPPGAGARTYVLHIEGGGASIPSDPRILDFRVFSISLK